MKIQTKESGFTLIELLVVVAIIGLLSSVVLTGLNSAKQKAEYQEFGSNLVQLRNALQLYATDNGGAYPGPLSSGSYGLLTNGVISTLVDGGYLTDTVSLDILSFGGVLAIPDPTEDEDWGCGSPNNLTSGFMIFGFSPNVNLTDELGMAHLFDGEIDIGTGADPSIAWYCIIQN